MDFAEAQRSPTKHPVGLGVVILLHALVGWALVSGLARKVVEVVKAPIETKLIEEVKPPPPPPPEKLPPPPPKSLPPPPAFVPPPEVQVTPPPTPQQTITTTTVQPPPSEVKISPAPAVVAAPPAPPAPPAPRVARPAIGNISACAPKGDEDYPAAARRAEATGTTRVRFTVDANGGLAKAEVVKPSGVSKEHRQMDRVAVDKLSECTFKPGIDENGKPVGGTFEVDYVWKLE